MYVNLRSFLKISSKERENTGKRKFFLQKRAKKIRYGAENKLFPELLMTQENTQAKNEEWKLASFMDVSRILYFRGKQKKDDVLKALIKSIASAEKFGSEDDIEWGIMHREELMSTGIGKNIATPHTSIGGIEESCVALAVCPGGIADYQAQDSLPVKLVFMIVTPRETALPRLKLLAGIGNLFYDGRLKTACLAADDPERCYAIIERAQ